jgi:hypothetical protein
MSDELQVDPPASAPENVAPPTDSFRAACERQGLTDPALIQLAERIARGAPDLVPHEAISVLVQPGVADSLADIPGVAERILEWSATDTLFRRTVFPRFAEALRARALRPRALAEEVYQRALRALRDSYLPQARACLEELLPELAPERAVRVYEELFTALDSPEKLTDMVRLFLLPRVLPRDALAGQMAGQRAARWLTVAPEHLEELLSLAIAPPYKLMAVSVCLDRHPEATGTVALVLASRPELLLDVLPRLVESQARQVFEQAVEVVKPGKLIDDLLRRAERMPTALLDFCLETLLNKGEGGLAWARRSWKDLVRLLPGGRSSAALARLVLERPDNEPDGDLLDFLAEVERSNASRHLAPEERQYLSDQLSIEGFLRKPALDEEKLTDVASAVRRLVPGPLAEKLRDRVTRAVREVLWKLPIDPQVGLERVLVLLGPVLAGGAGELYAYLIDEYQKRRDLLQRALLIHALIAVGFGETHRSELNEQVDPGEAVELLALVRKKRGGEEVVRYLEERVRNWAPSAREQWLTATTPGAKPISRRKPPAPAPAGNKPPARRWIGWSDVVLFVGVVLLVILGAILWYWFHPAEPSQPQSRPVPVRPS